MVCEGSWGILILMQQFQHKIVSGLFIAFNFVASVSFLDRNLIYISCSLIIAFPSFDPLSFLPRTPTFLHIFR